MVFSSFSFLFYFLPVFLLVYFLVPAICRNAVLFGASLLFYFYGVREHPWYLLLILLLLGLTIRLPVLLPDADRKAGGAYG